jgi:hypothetical protein
MSLISKNIFLKSLTCLTWGWYLRSSGIELLKTKSEEDRIEQGKKIGEMARSLYANGVLVDEGSNTSNYEKTKKLINDHNIQVIFEATFIHNGNIARADILKRIDGKWHLIEVKSSSASDEIKDELIDDLSYTALILSLCGIELERASLLLVSKDYRIGMDLKKFFVEVDCTEQVNERRPLFLERMNEISQVTCADKRPEPKLIYECKDCDYYKAHCLGKNVDDPVFYVPRLGREKFSELVEDKVFLVNQIPEHFNLSPSQKRVVEAVKDETPFIDKEKLKDLLDEIVYPTYYLDFESTSTAIPLYENIGPYQEIVTENDEEKHFEFLSDYTKDDRRTLAEKLLKDIGKEGSVIVYFAAAESRMLKSLAKLFPDLADDLNNIIERIVDLEKIAVETYYHPEFHGSYSIKVVLPVLVPEMSYKELEIGDGQSASVVFAELARGKYSQDEAALICEQLLKYCKQDTWAMVKIHEKLIQLSK